MEAVLLYQCKGAEFQKLRQIFYDVACAYDTSRTGTVWTVTRTGFTGGSVHMHLWRSYWKNQCWCFVGSETKNWTRF